MSEGLASTINRITNIIIAGVIVLFVIAAVGGILFFRMYQKRRRERLSEEELTYYSQLRRYDAKAYAMFDDIKDSMIITDHGATFTGIVACRGFDFYSAHVAERISTQAGYRSFINMISQPITFRQYATEVNLSDTKALYKKAYDENEESLFNVNEDYLLTVKTMKDMEKEFGEQAIESPEYMQVVETVEKLQKQLENMKWKRFHLEDQMEYISQIEGASSDPQPHETYIFDWHYNPYDFPVDLTEEEIYERAIKELQSKGQAIIHALSSAGVKAHRCTTKELIDMFWRHNNPVSANKTKIEDICDSAFFEDIVYTKDKDDLRKEYDETLAYDLMQSVAMGAGTVSVPVENNSHEKQNKQLGNDGTTEEIRDDISVNDNTVPADKNLSNSASHVSAKKPLNKYKEKTGNRKREKEAVSKDNIQEEEQRGQNHMNRKKADNNTSAGISMDEVLRASAEKGGQDRVQVKGEKGQSS